MLTGEAGPLSYAGAAPKLLDIDMRGFGIDNSGGGKGTYARVPPGLCGGGCRA